MKSVEDNATTQRYQCRVTPGVGVVAATWDSARAHNPAIPNRTVGTSACI